MLGLVIGLFYHRYPSLPWSSIYNFSGLAALVGAFSLYWTQMRGPCIISSPIYGISVSSKPIIASPDPTIKLSFILSNSGGSNGNIEYIFMKLKHISKEGKVLEEQMFKSHWGLNRNELPILIEKGRAESISDLEFVSDNGFRLNLGLYIIELYILFAGNTKLPNKILTTPTLEFNEVNLYEYSQFKFYLSDPIDKKYSGYIIKAEKS